MKKTKQKTNEMTWHMALEQCFSGKRDKFDDKNMVVVPAKVKEFVQAMGWSHRPPDEGGELLTNGWDYDWWLEFERDGKRMTVAGSGYYGGLSIYQGEV